MPLIRQAVGFSWTPSTNANVSTYQATVATQPVVPYFLPGQAPPPPPKPKPTKPRAPKRKKGQYSGQTGRFRLSDSAQQSSPVSGLASLAPSAGNSTGTSSSSATAPSRLMLSASSYPYGYPNGNATAGPSTIRTALPPGVRGTNNSARKQASDSCGQSSARPSPVQPSQICTFATPQYSNVGGSSEERPGRTLDSQRTYTPSGGTSSIGHTNGCETHWLISA